MDKNKNRTDLLAAGRKKLQQYRQKKDGKGSKSSNKANKPDRDVATGDSSSVSKPPPVQASSAELVELSSQGSTDTSPATNADMATSDLSSTSNVPIEVSKSDESVDDSVPNKDLQSSNLDDVIPIISPPRKIVTEGEHESGFTVGLKAVLDDRIDHKAGEMIAVHGEDQVPDVGTLQEDNRTSLIDVEGEMNQVSSGDVEEDAKMESRSSGIEQISEERDGFSASGPGIGDSGDTNADVDVHSASGLLSSDHEPGIGYSGDTNVDVHSDSGIPPSSDHEPGIGDSGDTNVDVRSTSVLHPSSEKEPAIGDSGDINADVHSASGLPSSSDHDPSIGDSDVHSASGLPSSDHEPSIGDSSDTNADVHSASGLPSSDQEPAFGDSGDTKADVNSASGLHSSSDPEPRIGDSDVTDADKHSLSGLVYSDLEPTIADSGDTKADVNSASGFHSSSDHEPRIDDSDVTNEDIHSLSGLLYSDLEPTIADSSDTKADVNSASGLHSSSDPEPRIGDSDVTNADSPSLSGLLYSDHEPTIADSGDTKADVNSAAGLHSSSDPEPRIGDSDVTNADSPSLSGLLYSDHEPRIGDSDVTNADSPSLSGLLYSDHEPRIGDSDVTNADSPSLSGLLYSDQEPTIADSGDTNADVVVDIHMKSGSAEFPETLKEQLYIKNFEKELVHLQLCEERNVRKEFEQHRLQWVNEKSSFTASIDDLESKNKTLSEELAKCRSELDIVSDKIEELEMSVSFSKTELDWSSSRIQELQIEVSNVSSDLVDSKSLVSDLQSKNETLNANIASLTNEKEGLVSENEKLVKELKECKSLLELSQVDNVNVQESLALVMEERAKLEEARQIYESEKEKLQSDWKKLDAVLSSEREERNKHKEANEHFIQENNKVSMELLESKKSMESLQSEIANLNENLDMVTKERSKLGEDMNHLRSEKEEYLTELTNCKTLLKNLEVEYEKSMKESRDNTLKLEQLTQENVTLSSFEETFLKNVILDEFMKQYVSTVESKKGELVILCEDLIQEAIITKRTNSDLTEKLHNSESRIQDLQEQLEDARRAHNLLSDSYKDMTEKTNSDLTEKLHNSESRIQDLQEQLEDARRAHYLLSESYKDMTEKTKDLESTNELAAYVIHKVFDNLQKLVNNSDPTTESVHDDLRSGQVDHLEISNYDVFIERLIMILYERSQLEIKNREYNLELLRRIKDLEGSNKRFNYLDFALLEEKLKSKELQINQLTSSIASYELESFIFKESLRTSMEQIVVIQSETKIKETELHQSENRVSALREKLHIAVTKGKGLIQQRDALKQNLTIKDSAIQELETKLKSYSEAGERMEALESELSYIRNSATALRESFLLKDSVLQRIEEILEDLDLPEHFHDREIIDKIDWLAKSVSHGPSQTGVIERAHSYPGSGPIDGWKEDLEPVSDELRRNYEELQNKFYELAEQNEMLEQSLMERNNVVQRFEEVLEKTNMPLQLRLLEPEDKIDWLRVALVEASDRCALLEQSLMERNKVVQRCEEVLEKTDMPLELRSVELEEKIDWLCGVLAEENDRCALLEQSLMERNNVVQRCEEILEKTYMPPHLRSLEPEAKVDWLRVALGEANDRCALLHERHNLMQRCEEVLEKTNMPPHVRSLEPEAKIDWLSVALGEANDRCALLHERHNLMQRCEEVLEKTNIPPHLQSLEPEAKIDWLRVALAEANDRCALLQQDLEKVRGSLSADLEESNRRLLDLQENLKLIADEKEQILARFEAQSQDYNKISEKVELYEIENEKLQNEIHALQSKLAEKGVDEEHIHHVHGEIKRLQDLVKNMLQDSEMEDLDSSMNDIECLEGLLRKLEEKYPKYPSGERSIGQLEILESKLEQVEGDLMQVKEERDKQMEKSQSLVNEVEALVVKNQQVEGDLVQVKEERDKHMEKSQSLVNEVEALVVKNQEVEGDLVKVKEERDKHMEKSQSLVNEVEALVVKNQELQKLLVQEEQKCGVVREKLNVAVRKGKSLVQQRDAMKQTINELTAEVARLTSEIKVRENTLLAHQEKMKDLFTLQELVDNKDSEIGFLKNRLEEILRVLGEIDVGVELKSNDPIEKIEQIQKTCRDLQDGILSAEQDSRKSKRAAELLLEELNEVQERNEDLLEEISKVSNEKKIAEAATRDSLSHLEQLSAVHLEERSIQFEELMKLKSDLEQLRPELIKIFNLVDDVLPKDLDHLYNLESGVKSLLESSDASNSSHGGIISRKDSKENLHSRLFLDTKREQQHSDNEIMDLWRFIGTHMQDLITNINLFQEKLHAHSKSLHKEAINLSETISTLHKEITSNKYSLESINKQKETEILALHKHVSMLYEACKNSVFEIEKTKGQLDSNDDMESSLFIEGETLVSEEQIVSIVNRLLLLVKDVNSIQTENMEVNQKEMKATISSLQKELTEKDVQKDRMCVDLVSQIKRAETAAMNNLQELESAKVQINDMKGQLEAVNLECNALKQRVKEVEEDKESILVDLQEKVKSLTQALTAKEQEAEALLQALDEEEAQMEDLTNKITELETQIQQKNLDLKNTESARGKALKKLSITVKKFDELHHLSETLVSEIDNLQSQIQERDSEISFLRDEITRCTSDSLQALETDKKNLDGIQDILTFLESQDLNLEDNNGDQVLEFKEVLKKQITSIISELKELRQVAQSKDDLLQIERSKVEDLNQKRELLESSLKEQESRLSLHQENNDSVHTTSMTSEIVEVEPVINNWQPKGASMAPQVRSLRKVNNDQLAISIDDIDSDEKDKLEDEDDDKAHGFKSLTTSKLVPKFTRPVTNFVDGLWVSCDRALQRQPVLRLRSGFWF
ncbi:hypothetical protein L2E82_48251 [Cichorium intybus]|uniref:Uncharacterized protein n=1 Tax=Cichorium intybus TaxID=13427 RepID=A0ACB8YXM5_CICIN|nr:hypothetical protein L2E82_48251 [Cichorium intybus]